MSEQQMEVELRKILFAAPLSKRIEIVERLGKKLRQQNSMETAREVREFQARFSLIKRLPNE
jgi:hypothetical protein